MAAMQELVADQTIEKFFSQRNGKERMNFRNSVEKHNVTGFIWQRSGLGYLEFQAFLL